MCRQRRGMSRKLRDTLLHPMLPPGAIRGSDTTPDAVEGNTGRETASPAKGGNTGGRRVSVLLMM